jgi:hypothetical protein
MRQYAVVFQMNNSPFIGYLYATSFEDAELRLQGIITTGKLWELSKKLLRQTKW